MPKSLAGGVDSAVSGALLGMRRGGLAGWQWLFIREGMPAVGLGPALYWLRTDGPAEAKWLSEEQRGWLLGELEREQESNSDGASSGIWDVLANGQIWLLSLVYFGIPACMDGVTMWLPSAI